MRPENHEINYEKWKRVIEITQILIVVAIFITEVVCNFMLYSTRSQGYDENTIFQKLIRYLLLTTAINIVIMVASRIITSSKASIEVKKYTLVISIVLICANAACNHYQFADTMAIFVIPLLISIFYEDNVLTTSALVLSLIGLAVASILRGRDPLYNTDIIPETAIAFAFILSVYFITRILVNTLTERRRDLGEAMVEAEQANASAERSKLSLKMLETLARTIDAKDRYTNGHSIRVAGYATDIARALGWSNEQVEMLKFEALLHDIGKIGVPDSVLNKPSRLTDTEFDIIKSHTLVGANILRAMVAVPNAFSVAKFHHERFDGKGYPRSIKGKDIPLNARIVCIADSYDAMSSNRIYRDALSKEVIREELVKGRGKQFDPELLDVFLGLFDENKLTVVESAGLFDDKNEDNEREFIMEEIEKVIRNTSELEMRNNAYNDFDRFYKYMRNIGLRYNRSIEVISVTAEGGEGAVLPEDREKFSASLEQAIKRNIREVDVYYKNSDLVHMVILLDAGKENIDIILNRIAYDFSMSDKYKLVCELNDNIGTMSSMN